MPDIDSVRSRASCETMASNVTPPDGTEIIQDLTFLQETCVVIPVLPVALPMLFSLTRLVCWFQLDSNAGYEGDDEGKKDKHPKGKAKQSNTRQKVPT